MTYMILLGVTICIGHLPWTYFQGFWYWPDYVNQFYTCYMSLNVVLFSDYAPPPLGKVTALQPTVYSINTRYSNVNWLHHTESKMYCDEIFATGSTGNCQNEKFRCRYWRQFRQNNAIFILLYEHDVAWLGPANPSFAFTAWHRFVAIFRSFIQ